MNDSVTDQRSRHRGRMAPPRVVALGGGAGLHGLLRGLNSEVEDLTAIITVADDGGSSGRIRKDFEIPPPGDLRRCLVALAEADPLIGELFEYRFDEGVLQGHSFGNLFIAVLAKLSGNFRQAVDRAASILGVRGSVIPSTELKVVLVAEHPDGSKSTGEEVISKSGKPISRLRLTPKPPPVSEEISSKIAAADLICLGPGSIYTSVGPNLLVPGMIEAINASSARVVWIANLLTQPGETDGFDLEDHYQVFQTMEPPLGIDTVLVPEVAVDLSEHDSGYGGLARSIEPCFRNEELSSKLHKAPLVASERLVRHDPAKLARALLSLD